MSSGIALIERPGRAPREKLIARVVIRIDEPLLLRVGEYQRERYREARIPMSLAHAIRELVESALDARQIEGEEIETAKGRRRA